MTDSTLTPVSAGFGLFIKHGEYGVGSGYGPGGVLELGEESPLRQNTLWSVAFAGIYPFGLAGGSISTGDIITPDSTGRWTTQSGNTASGFQAITAASAANDRFCILVK